MDLLKVLKYITYRRLSDSSSTFFPWDIFLKKQEINDDIIKKYISKKNKGLYIHIPYCVTECTYCACFKKKLSRNDNLSEYVSYLLRELELYYIANNNEKIIFDTIVFGWWTPSILKVDDLEKLFNCIYKYVNKNFIKEISFEIAPYCINFYKIDILKKYWVTRISMWIQSFNEEVMKKNNRVFVEYDKIQQIIEYIKSLNIICVADLLIWIESQELSIVIDDYKKIFSLNLDDVNINYFYSNLESKYKFSRKNLKIRNDFLRFVKEKGLNIFSKKEFVLLQEHKLYFDDQYSVIWLWVWAISIFWWDLVLKKDSFSEYFERLDKNEFMFWKNIKISNQMKALKFIFRNIDNKIYFDFLNNRYDIFFQDIFSSELSFLRSNNIIQENDKYILFQNNLIKKQIYFSIFLLKFLDKNTFLDLHKYSHEDLNIFLLSLLDEI